MSIYLLSATQQSMLPRRCKRLWDGVQIRLLILANVTIALLSVRANRFAAASLGEVLQLLSRHAIKYKQEYGEIPVLIIDNANRLVQKKQELLDLFQDYAKDAADKGRVTVVFVSSAGCVLRHMSGKSIML